ncbi:tRNA-intron endonuclease [Candidatus Caldarchaeum subterraneum]|uniref:tRNA-intron endonuclease n=1 Tax=Caldiarchaeum subterraneum TaxID=311458 RepID=E6N8B4_CALS0|nr:tRNA-intron endonuclease [Candidatus Caldarchaeum subterraneum]BAJ48575.1 tRNA-intron endonuclease [Candidatus Caldarchaeum subterraneum]BAJ51287.1 tRNA-intron endonuclease [Candidatus Caldarchaeum subterraneum]
MFEGLLLGDSVVVWDVEQARQLYRLGFYGKPLGIPKPKDMNFDAPLVLDLVEALYLARQRKLRILRGGVEVSPKEFEEYASSVEPNFPTKYRVYSDLRDRGFVVLPGIKFGSDFAVYRHGPGIDHAPFIIQIKKGDEKLSALEIIRAGRLATSVKKHFTISVPAEEKVVYLMFEWWRA